jgi:ATP-binding cassette subfamily B protein
LGPLLRFTRRYVVPYAHWYAGGLLALIATNALSVTIPLYLAEGIDALAHGARDLHAIGRSAVIIAAMGAVTIVVRTVSRVLFFTPGRLVEARLKHDLFAAILRHQPVFLRRFETGDLFSRVSADVNMLRLAAGFGVLQLANAILAVLFAGGQMARVSPTLAAWLVPPILVALVLMQVSIQRMFLLMRRVQVELATLSSHVLASYRGVATVQGFAAEDAFLAGFDAKSEAWLRTTVGQSTLRAFLGPILALAVDVDVFLLLLIGGPMAVRGEITVGELVAFTTLVAYVSRPLRASSFLYSIVKQAQAALERFDAIVEAPVDRPDLPHPAAPPERAPAIELRDLTFTWPGASAPSLEHVSVTIPAGSTLGVLGPTGSGKSTLLTLLARLYDPPPGTILVDGTDLRRIDLDGWRDRTTLVPQRPFLFSESLADNVLLGRDDPALLARVLDQAALGPDVAVLPEGTATLVGETGVRLSGGQRQRTALARGLARDHLVLLLDDVLSAVDHATERELVGTLRGAGGHGRVTTVLVAHRVSALRHADHVLVLEGGRVVDQGRPDELLQRPGLFRDTWLQQQAEDA